MKPILLATALWTATAMAAAPLDGIQRIVFLGDSITQAGDYVTDVECWLISQGHRVEVLDIGLSSESATELTDAENAGHARAFGFPTEASWTRCVCGCCWGVVKETVS